MPLISIIIPLYNKGPYVERALNSVFNQTLLDFEVIVVDGGSTDNGPEIVRNYPDPRIRMIQQVGKGLAEARNQGVEVATTDFFAFLDADDEWTPSHLKTIFRLIKKFPDAGMYNTAFKFHYPNGKSRWNNYRCIPDAPWEGLIPNYFKSAAVGATPFLPSVSVVSRKVFYEVGEFTPGTGEDHDFFGKVALRYPVAFSWEQGGIYYLDATNRLSHNRPPFEKEETFVTTARKALASGKVLPEHVEPLNEYIYIKEINRAGQYVQWGDGKTARSILNKCKTKWNNKKKAEIWLLSIVPHPIFMFVQNQKRRFF